MKIILNEDGDKILEKFKYAHDIPILKIKNTFRFQPGEKAAIKECITRERVINRYNFFEENLHEIFEEERIGNDWLVRLYGLMHNIFNEPEKGLADELDLRVELDWTSEGVIFVPKHESQKEFFQKVKAKEGNKKHLNSLIEVSFLEDAIRCYVSKRRVIMVFDSTLIFVLGLRRDPDSSNQVYGIFLQDFGWIPQWDSESSLNYMGLRVDIDEYYIEEIGDWHTESRYSIEKKTTEFIESTAALRNQAFSTFKFYGPRIEDGVVQANDVDSVRFKTFDLLKDKINIGEIVYTAVLNYLSSQEEDDYISRRFEEVKVGHYLIVMPPIGGAGHYSVFNVSTGKAYRAYDSNFVSLDYGFDVVYEETFTYEIVESRVLRQFVKYMPVLKVTDLYGYFAQDKNFRSKADFVDGARFECKFEMFLNNEQHPGLVSKHGILHVIPKSDVNVVLKYMVDWINNNVYF